MASAVATYIDFTRLLIRAKKLYSGSFSFDVDATETMGEPEGIKFKYDELFPRRMLRCGRELSFSDWQMNGVFPLLLYTELGDNLAALAGDPRFHEAPIYSKKEGWSSFFGRAMGRMANNTTPLLYMLARMRVPLHRGMPHFYFNVEDPMWVFEPLMTNLNLLKTGRTALACLMAWSFKWDNDDERLHCCMVMRSNQWSHLWGDVFGGRAAMIAILRELGLEKGSVTIFSPSFSLDTPKEAKELVNGANYD